MNKIRINGNGHGNPRPRNNVGSLELNANSQIVQSLMEIAHAVFSPDKDERTDALAVLNIPSDCRRLKFDYIMLSRHSNEVTLGVTYDHRGDQHHAALKMGKSPYETPHRPHSGKVAVYHF